MPRTCQHSGCDRRLRRDNRSGYCYKHHRLCDRVRRLVCKHSSCNLTLAPRNRSGWCRSHRRSDERKGIVRVVCMHTQCDKRLQSNNASGWCKAHHQSRERYMRDEVYRQRMVWKSNNRYHRVGGHAHRRSWRELDAIQSNFCGICGERMYGDVEVDHIYPVHLGGSSELDNLQAVHKSCNSRKQDDYDLFALAGVRA